MSFDPAESNNNRIIHLDDLERKRTVWLLSTFGLAGTAMAAVAAGTAMAETVWISAIAVVVATSLLISGLIVFIRYNLSTREKNRVDNK